jgi:hypothetical protein
MAGDNTILSPESCTLDACPTTRVDKEVMYLQSHILKIFSSDNSLMSPSASRVPTEIHR